MASLDPQWAGGRPRLITTTDRALIVKTARGLSQAEGQAVATSIVNAGLLHASYAWIHADGTPGPWGHVDGDQYGLSPFYRMYRCADDRWIFVAALDPESRRRLVDALGERGVDLDDDKVAALLEERLASRPAGDWFADLDPVVPVEIVDELFCRRLFDDEEARASGLVATTWAGSVGRFEDPGLLVGFSETPGIVQRGPSMCGEHTREILLELDYGEAEVDAMAADRVVLDAPVERLGRQ